MSNDLRFVILFVALLLYLAIFVIFKKGRIPLKFALVWLFPTTIILFVGILPDFLISIMNLLGFQTLSNMIIGMLFLILIFICIALTIIVSGQNTKITLLIQEISLLKGKYDERK